MSGINGNVLFAINALIGIPLVTCTATYPSEFTLGWCYNAECINSTISAAHFQLRANAYYLKGGRPPLHDAMFLTTAPLEYQRDLLLSCPGMLVVAYLLTAEARIYTHPHEEAGELVARVVEMIEAPELDGPHRDGMWATWPVQAALSKYNSLAQTMDETRLQLGPMSLDFVIPRCHEDLEWINEKLDPLPPRTRFFIYEKCGESDTDLSAKLSAQLAGRASIHIVQLPDRDDPLTGAVARRDECAAYLAHVVRHPARELADATLFLHGDPTDHTPMPFLTSVLRALALGSLRDVEFLHLGAPRLVHVYNPCQDGVFEVAVGRERRKLLSTYCCSQFLVSRKRIAARSQDEWTKVLKLVDGSTPDICERTGPSYEKYPGQRLSYCYFLEFMWHVVFGEDEELPLRVDDERLPVFLRLREYRAEILPNPWSSYLVHYISGTQRMGHPQTRHLWRKVMRPPLA